MAQRLTPSGSMSTPAVEPHVLPPGSLAHPSTLRNGFGRSLIGAGIWAARPSAWPVARAPTRATSVTFQRSAGPMGAPPLCMSGDRVRLGGGGPGREGRTRERRKTMTNDKGWQRLSLHAALALGVLAIAPLAAEAQGP